ncbi:stage V sporulation protein E [Numidum massiliense]|uniref:stage V sporulation protein E n=1 Tax=Numidum massiliense TaxID=1522315 RepID=UPI0006D5423B|nr:stage V sporulation protein E [Numidum massiliense]
MAKDRGAADPWLTAAVWLLLCVGVLMVYSASAVLSYHKFDDSLYYAKRQLLFAVLGVFLMLWLARLDYDTWQKWSRTGLIACFVLLAVVLIPGAGILRNGARSWLGLGAFSIQPSEFTKLALIVFLAHWLPTRKQNLTRFTTGLLPPLALLAAAFGLIMAQPDLGTGTVLFATGMLIIFVAGMRIKHLMAMVALGLAGFTALVASAPYRIDRITAFLDPWQDRLGSGYQIIQSLFAIGPGRLMGVGYGLSKQKHLYLPEPQTDFIFSVTAEELGFIGAATVVVLFLIVVWRGVHIAFRAPDLPGTLMAVGITGMIGIQALMNIGVVTGMLPVTGITLPFLSYGGSSLTLTLVAVGILLNISRYAR